MKQGNVRFIKLKKKKEVAKWYELHGKYFHVSIVTL